MIEGLHELLRGTGLEEKIQLNGGYTVIRKNKNSGTTTLEPMSVVGKESTTEGTGSYTTGLTSTATGLNLSLRETPQSVSVITHQRIKDQGMNTIGDALRSTTGISVKATDRGRNSLSARGFTIDNFQIDGIPFATGNVGMETASTAIYDRVEVVRGATGLLSGAGDPSATVNLVRKHADSKIFTGIASAELGSWDHRSGTIDVTTPLTEDGSVRARIVASHTEKEAFIDLENTENTVFYTVLDADLSEQTQLSLGASYEKNERNGIYWGGLPYFYSDGSLTDWDRSTTTATSWNQWDTEEQTFFITLDQQLENQWQLSVNASYYEQKEDSNLLWVYGEPDPVTGLGMSAYPYLYGTNPEQYQFGVSMSGPFQWMGYENELSMGILHSQQKGGWDNGGVPLSAIPAVGDFNQWDGSYPEPVWDTPDVGSRDKTTQSAIYSSVRLQMTDSLKAILGGRLTNWKREEGVGIWTPEAYEFRHNNVFTPFLGVVYDINESVSAYASYSTIFKPQDNRDKSGDYLDPLDGDTYEVGVKKEFFDGALNASAAVFSVRQDNFAVQDGTNLVPGTSSFAYFAAEGVEVDGYELEVSGEIQPGWVVSLGWTRFSAKDPDGNDVVVEHPRKMLKMFTKYDMQETLAGLSLGAGLNWQDDEPRLATNPSTGNDEKVGESAYTLVDVMAGYQVNEQMSLQLNVNNVFDKKYKESSWGTFTYGEPRNALLSMNYRF